jgi:hypothetical protein
MTGCGGVFSCNRHSSNPGKGVTQYGRTLHELNVDTLCANGSQAKGGVERANLTLQDRLVKELRLRNIDTKEADPTFLFGPRPDICICPRYNSDVLLKKEANPTEVHERAKHGRHADSCYQISRTKPNARRRQPPPHRSRSQQFSE